MLDFIEELTDLAEETASSSAECCAQSDRINECGRLRQELLIVDMLSKDLGQSPVRPGDQSTCRIQAEFHLTGEVGKHG
jgi:hypothetical protein